MVEYEAGYEVGALVTYHCQTGYTVNGNNTRTCQADGTWTGTEPTCEPTYCSEPPPAPSNGTVSQPEMSTFGSVVEYACDHGYELTGTANLTCQADGTWSGSAPVCNSVQGCPKIPNHAGHLTLGGTPMAGYVTGSEVGSVVAYACQKGYALNGNRTRTCQADGTWTGTEPTCEPTSVWSRPGSFINGEMMVLTTLTGRRQANYTCDPGYDLTGVSVLTCQDDGRWSGSVPTCTKQGGSDDVSSHGNGSAARKPFATVLVLMALTVTLLTVDLAWIYPS